MSGEPDLDDMAMNRNLRSFAPMIKGLTLIELMVAIALGGLLMSGAITLFVNNRATYEMTTDMSRLQENARYALQAMVADLRTAGHIGCGNEQASVNNNTGLSSGQLADPTNGLEGFETGAAGWSPSAYAGGAFSPVSGFLANSDGVTVRYLVGEREDTDAATTVLDMEVTNSVYSGNLAIDVDNNTSAIELGDVAGVSDCGGTDIFLVTAVSGDTITANTLSRAYGTINKAVVSQYIGVRYFLRNNAEGIPSLFRVGFAEASSTELPLANQEELVDGVRSMQILYGIDADSDGVPEQFLAAGTAGLQTRNDWLSVISVRIALLMETVDAISRGTDDNVYDVGDVRFCRAGIVPTPNPVCTVALPSDGRRRRVFQTTVSIRNS